MRFNFTIVSDDGEIIVSDWTTFVPSTIKQFGECEAVDMEVAKALRYVRRELEKLRIGLEVVK